MCGIYVLYGIQTETEHRHLLTVQSWSFLPVNSPRRISSGAGPRLFLTEVMSAASQTETNAEYGKKEYSPHSVSTLKKTHIHRRATSRNISTKMELSSSVMWSYR